ncbi:thiamine biosynthesis lipoprotein [Candidatus Photodesmus blepharus]|uniref:FAD:protein FMN transferase n=2 Tax=Candidatus Photodesmus blepharonis TaxID=1179155 RepID=A0A084CP17_9GAMM|nr:thiamine biosynthesis lipoprotein [Candidatus Photodesmus blepharus]
MGTTYNIKYLETEETLASEELGAQISYLLEEISNQMSTYRKDSELSQFNQYQSNLPFRVSPQIVIVLREAIRINHLTLGALDITLGPLVNLWGFGPEAKFVDVPTSAELKECQASIGIHHLNVTDLAISKKLPGLYIDLSAIVKGWGVDVIANHMKSKGIQNYMVEIGGEMYLQGVNRKGVPWRIAVEKPTLDRRSIQKIIEPGNTAVATSGDYRNYFERDGIRYSHILDPKTGKPITHTVVSVTVFDKSSMTADGLATGLMVLGEIKGMEVANRHNIPVYMIVKTEDGFREVVSEAYKTFVKEIE